MIDLLKITDQFQRDHVHAMFFTSKQPLSFNAYFHAVLEFLVYLFLLKNED